MDDFHHCYAETLDIQARLLAPQSREVLSSLEGFLNAKTVLEVGCGAGAQTAALAALLDGKRYLGIDISNEFIRMAQQRFAGKSGISFQLQDIMSFQPPEPYDFLLSFNVLQHVSDVKAALQRYLQFVKRGGLIAVHDTNEQEGYQSEPDLPEFRKLFRSLTEEKTIGKRKDRCLMEIKKLAPEMDCKIVLERQNNQVINTSTERGLFTRYANNIVRLVQEMYDFSLDQEKIRTELEFWQNTPRSWVKLRGGSWLVLLNTAPR